MTTHHRLAALYDTHHERVFRFCLRLCSGHQEDAEDLTQEVFLAALGSLPRFAGRSSVQTWLFRIVVFRSRERRLLHQKRAAQQESFWRNRLAQVAKVHPRWDKWQSRGGLSKNRPACGFSA